MHFFTSFSVLFLTFLACSTNQNLQFKTNSNGFFQDQFGRVAFFHGFNSVCKYPPWYDAQMLNTTRADYFKAWGFNLVRLGAIWGGLQPSSNQKLNQSLVDALRKIVRMQGAKGIRSLLDMHQDVLSSKFRGYDGAPRWLIDKLPAAPEQFAYPFPFDRKPSNWAEGYLTWSVGHAFEQIYKNVSNSLNVWADFWAKMAGQFHSEPFVLGYELMNEPWAGNIYRNPKLLLPGYAGKTNLLPAYDQVVRAIRKNDPEKIVFYEPVTWGVFLPTRKYDNYLSTGFDRVPGSNSSFDRSRSALSYHYYCWFVSESQEARVFPTWQRVLCDDVLLENVFNSARMTIQSTGGGSILTEFGICQPDNSSVSENSVECRTVLDKADENMQSWTYWDSEFFTKSASATPRDSVVKVFSRAYPRFVAGQPIRFKFNVDTAEFVFEFRLNSDITEPTEIFLPMAVHYKSKGFNHRVVSIIHFNTTFNAENSVFTITKFPNTNYPQDMFVKVFIWKK